MSRNPTREQFIQALENSLEYCQEADDAGSIDHEMAWWQKWVSEWSPIADEDGGI